MNSENATPGPSSFPGSFSVSGAVRTGYEPTAFTGTRILIPPLFVVLIGADYCHETTPFDHDQSTPSPPDRSFNLSGNGGAQNRTRSCRQEAQQKRRKRDALEKATANRKKGQTLRRQRERRQARTSEDLQNERPSKRQMAQRCRRQKE